MTHPLIIRRIWLTEAIERGSVVPVPVKQAAELLLTQRPDLVECQVERDHMEEIRRELT